MEGKLKFSIIFWKMISTIFNEILKIVKWGVEIISKDLSKSRNVIFLMENLGNQHGGWKI